MAAADIQFESLNGMLDHIIMGIPKQSKLKLISRALRSKEIEAVRVLVSCDDIDSEDIKKVQTVLNSRN